MLASADGALIAAFNRAYSSLPSFKRQSQALVSQQWNGSTTHPPTVRCLNDCVYEHARAGREIEIVSNRKPHISLCVFVGWCVEGIAVCVCLCVCLFVRMCISACEMIFYLPRPTTPLRLHVLVPFKTMYCLSRSKYTFLFILSP